MKYKEIETGIFISRPNRFIAKVLVNGIEETVHVRNTGRCKELLIPNSKVILEHVNSTTRKTKYSLIAVYKGNILINMDSNIPNAVVEEALLNNKININADKIKREVTYKNSRFDLSFEVDGVKSFLEVKGVTLESKGIAKFPDAPTTRGKKHVLELIQAKKEGYNAYILFLIQMDTIKHFTPNYDTDIEFSNSLVLAKQNGVEIMAFTSNVVENEITIGESVKIIF